MAQDAVEHDYHLVNPSPWPFVGSAAATVMAIGGVIWMKGMFGLEKETDLEVELSALAKDLEIILHHFETKYT